MQTSFKYGPLRGCRKKIGASSTKQRSPSFVPRSPPGYLSWRYYRYGTKMQRCPLQAFPGVSGQRGRPLYFSLSLSLPHLFLFFPLDSDKFRELHTEKATAVLNIVLNTVMPNVHIWASFRFVAARISFPRYEIIFISFTNLMYPRGRRRVSRPNWRQSLHY